MCQHKRSETVNLLESFDVTQLWRFGLNGSGAATMSVYVIKCK